MNLYTIEEVKKHNKIKDAWLIYNGDVYNITDYIKLHPGSMSIKKGFGKDATIIINKIGHSKRAIEIMSKYKIGILKE
tara:strand:+ start:81 stop:314 length:234 start_codon:yes stop_codon:yes gene_type:complete